MFGAAFELIFCKICCFKLCIFGIWYFFLQIDVSKIFESRATFTDLSFVIVILMGEMKFFSKNELFSMRPCLSSFFNSVLTLSCLFIGTFLFGDELGSFCETLNWRWGFFTYQFALLDQEIPLQLRGVVVPGLPLNHLHCFPSDERIQILQESCKMIQNLQDSCKNLARYQSRPKNKSGYKCFRKHLWNKFLFTEQVTKPNSMKKK